MGRGCAGVTSARKSPARGRRRGGPYATRALPKDGTQKRASSNSTGAPLFRPLPLRERSPRELLRSTLIRAIEQADDPINKLRCLELFPRVALDLRLRLHDQRILGRRLNPLARKASPLSVPPPRSTRLPGRPTDCFVTRFTSGCMRTNQQRTSDGKPRAPDSASLAAWEPSLWADSGPSAIAMQWQESANSGRCPARWRAPQINPKRTAIVENSRVSPWP
jgi:hypothetical protein